MRNFVIETLNIGLWLVFVSIIVSGFFFGGNFGGAAMAGPDEAPQFNILIALVGGLMGFVYAAMICGVFFILMDLRRYARRTVELLERADVSQS